MSSIANSSGPSGISGPDERGGYALWAHTAAGVEVRFTGSGPAGAQAARADVLAAVAGVVEPVHDGARLPVAWARQVHGARVLDAAIDAPIGVDGDPCGEGDALVTTERGLALAIATADCVPLLLAAPRAIAAAHAGWRGLVAGVVPNAVAALVARGAAPHEITAWIGPAIGACCYEVGDEVARAIAAVSDETVVWIGPNGRSHLDLSAVARRQLARLGLTAIHSIPTCTRCDPRLWSYRRDGRGAGRNLAFVWRA